jgi:hypothetical protein
MVTPISGDLGNALAADLKALASGSTNLLAAADSALLSGAPLSEEAGTLLDLVEQAVAQTAASAIEAATATQTPAALAADTVAISPEALAQAAATGLPALLYDNTPAYPRPIEGRRLGADGDINPVSGIELWQNAIHRLRENASDPPPQRQSLARPQRVCPFCGKVHAATADPARGEEEICSVSFTASSEQSANR